MHFGNLKAMAIAACIGTIFSIPVSLAQGSGSLVCTTGQCTYSSPPAGTTHWEWSIYRIGGGAVGSPYNCANHYICDFSCAVSGTAHVTVIATNASNEVIGSVSDTAFCPGGGGGIPPL